MGQVYTATTIKDINASNPPEGATDLPELNDADRETRLVLKYQYSISTITTPTTLTSAYSVVVFGATTTATLPVASTVASSTFTKIFYFVNPVGSGFTGTLAGTVNGVVNPTLSAGEGMIVWTEGTSYFDHRPKFAGTSSSVFEGATARTLASTPTASTAPVRDANKDLLDRNSNPIYGVATPVTAKNASLVTLSGDVQILTFDLGTVTSGDIISVDAHTRGLKAAGTSGQVSVTMDKVSGTATFVIGSDATERTTSRYCGYAEYETLDTSGLLRVTGSGSLVLQLHGTAAGSTFGISAGGSQVAAYFLKKQ